MTNLYINLETILVINNAIVYKLVYKLITDC